MINIVLPKEVEQLVEGNIFDSAGLIQDDILAKFIFYNPEIIRIYGMALAELKHDRSLLAQEIKELNEDIVKDEARMVLKMDPLVYKNEDLRQAKKYTSEGLSVKRDEVRQKEKELIGLQSGIDQTLQVYYKYKNMQDALTNLTKLRVSERKY